MKEYIVLEQGKIPELVKDVNRHMGLGYVPIGGISKWAKGGATGFMQSMLITREPEPTEKTKRRLFK